MVRIMIFIDFPLYIAMFGFDVCFLSRLTGLISEKDRQETHDFYHQIWANRETKSLKPYLEIEPSTATKK